MKSDLQVFRLIVIITVINHIITSNINGRVTYYVSHVILQQIHIANIKSIND